MKKYLVFSFLLLLITAFAPGQNQQKTKQGYVFAGLNLWNEILFDYQTMTKEQDFTVTIKTLAGMSQFIITDITNPKSSPLELQATLPEYMIPFVPIIHESEEPFAMFYDLKQKFGEWILDILKYDSVDNLIKVFDKAIVAPAIKKAEALRLKKAEEIRVRHIKEYL